MRFHPTARRIVTRAIVKAPHLKIGAKFPVNALEQVKVVGCDDPGRVVTCGAEHVPVFFQVHPDQQHTARPDQAARHGEKCLRLEGRKAPHCRSRIKHRLFLQLHSGELGQDETARVVCDKAANIHPGEISKQARPDQS